MIEHEKCHKFCHYANRGGGDFEVEIIFITKVEIIFITKDLTNECNDIGTFVSRVD